MGIIDRRDGDSQRLGGSRDRCATCCSIIGQRYRQNGRAIRIGRRRKDELASGINRWLNREQPIVVVRYREAQRLGYFWIAIGN